MKPTTNIVFDRLTRRQQVTTDVGLLLFKKLILYTICMINCLYFIHGWLSQIISSYDVSEYTLFNVYIFCTAIIRNEIQKGVNLSCVTRSLVIARNGRFFDVFDDVTTSHFREALSVAHWSYRRELVFSFFCQSIK